MVLSTDVIKNVDIGTINYLFYMSRKKISSLLGVLEQVTRVKSGINYVINEIIATYTDEDFRQIDEIFHNYGIRYYSVYHHFYKEMLLCINYERSYNQPSILVDEDLKKKLNGELLRFLLKPLEDMPLYIHCETWIGRVAKWRLKSGK